LANSLAIGTCSDYPTIRGIGVFGRLGSEHILSFMPAGARMTFATGVGGNCVDALLDSGGSVDVSLTLVVSADGNVLNVPVTASNLTVRPSQ